MSSKSSIKWGGAAALWKSTCFAYGRFQLQSTPSPLTRISGSRCWVNAFFTCSPVGLLPVRLNTEPWQVQSRLQQHLDCWTFSCFFALHSDWLQYEANCIYCIDTTTLSHSLLSSCLCRAYLTRPARPRQNGLKTLRNQPCKTLWIKSSTQRK